MNFENLDKMKRFIKVIGIFLIVMLIAIFLANRSIINCTNDKHSDKIENVPNKKVGLLLGTNKNYSNGNPNKYFYNRIDAAVELYNAGKIKYIIASGDNSLPGYNEPEQMKEELIAKGIPEENIFLDFAGFRTLDSVVRANEIFNQDDIIIISQKFHNQRAIYIAEKYGIEAFGFNAKDVNSNNISKTQIREYFARLKVFLDILRRTEPKFLGNKIIID